MLHFTDPDSSDRHNDNLSYKRSSDPSISDHSSFAKLEALKREFLPKSLALHISLAKNKSADSVLSNAPNRAGLGLGAMVLSMDGKKKQLPSPAEVVINVGSADPLNNSGSVVSETDRYSTFFMAVFPIMSYEAPSILRPTARMRAFGTHGRSSPGGRSRGARSSVPGTMVTALLGGVDSHPSPPPSVPLRPHNLVLPCLLSL